MTVDLSTCQPGRRNIILKEKIINWIHPSINPVVNWATNNWLKCGDESKPLTNYAQLAKESP